MIENLCMLVKAKCLLEHALYEMSLGHALYKMLNCQ